MSDLVFYLRARCCTDWPIVAGYPLGRCGICKQVPVVVGTWDEEEHE